MNLKHDQVHELKLLIFFAGSTARFMSNKPEESAEAFDARWEAYFDRYNACTGIMLAPSFGIGTQEWAPLIVPTTSQPPPPPVVRTNLMSSFF